MNKETLSLNAYYTRWLQCIMHFFHRIPVRTMILLVQVDPMYQQNHIKTTLVLFFLQVFCIICMDDFNTRITTVQEFWWNKPLEILARLQDHGVYLYQRDLLNFCVTANLPQTHPVTTSNN